ncbi:MAG: hypothetical protein AAF004_05810 [Pseudomonadota bacterium]
MTRYITVAALAALLSGLLVYSLGAREADEQAPPSKVRDIVVGGATSVSIDVTALAADAQNAPTSIREVFAIQNLFRRRTATRVLAASANGDTVQALIFDADRIADDVERRATLTILFERFADEDPRSALQMARTDFFSNQIDLEQTVWQQWAGNNFNMALSAAAAETGTRERMTAARSLYLVSGFVDTPAAREIEEATGIKPDRKVRIAYIERMADESLGAAIAFVEGLPQGNSKREYSAWLAYHVSTIDPAASEQLTASLSDANAKRFVKSASARISAQLDPAQAVRSAIAAGGQALMDGRFQTAFQELATTDIDGALALAQSLETLQLKNGAYRIIASVMAQKDPDSALAWARQIDAEKGSAMNLESSVIMAIASTHPDRAISAANTIGNAQQRSRITQMAIQSVTMTDPEAAVSLLASIENSNDRNTASEQLARSWMYQDRDRALEWILSLDEAQSQRLGAKAIPTLAATDPERAISLLPMFKEGKQAELAQTIGSQLARSGSIDKALDFARRFDSKGETTTVEASVIGAIASFDEARALALAEQTFTGKALDDTLTQITNKMLYQNPASAAPVAMRIGNVEQRSIAIGNVVRRWGRTDQQAALTWATGLSDTPDRDTAIHRLAANLERPTPATIRAIDSIENEEIRTQAYISTAYNINRSDSRAAAQQLLDSANLNDEQKAKVLKALDGGG